MSEAELVKGGHTPVASAPGSPKGARSKKGKDKGAGDAPDNPATPRDAAKSAGGRESLKSGVARESVKSGGAKDLATDDEHPSDVRKKLSSGGRSFSDLKEPEVSTPEGATHKTGKKVKKSSKAEGGGKSGRGSQGSQRNSTGNRSSQGSESARNTNNSAREMDAKSAKGSDSQRNTNNNADSKSAKGKKGGGGILLLNVYS